MPSAQLDAYTRAAVFLGALLAVTIYTFLTHSETGLGALISLLSAAVAFQFRGRVEAPKE